MEYQDIVNSYKNGSLDITSFKKDLDKAKPLNGRKLLRTLKYLKPNESKSDKLTDLIMMPECPETLNEFYKNLNTFLINYFSLTIEIMIISGEIDFLGLDKKDYAIEDFTKLSAQEKISRICELEKQYLKLLKYQKLADFRDSAEKYLKNGKSAIESVEYKELLLFSIFEKIKNEEMKRELFSFSEEFLRQLYEFKAKKNIKLDDFMKLNKKNIQLEYESSLIDFTEEDLNEIATVMALAKSTLKIPIDGVIESFYQISEANFENYGLIKTIKKLEELKHKVERMDNILKSKEEKTEKKVEESITLDDTESNEKDKISEDSEGNSENKISEKVKKEDVILKTDEGLIGKMSEEVEDLRKSVTEKEKVKIILLFWADEEDKSFKDTVGSEKEELFFEKIKKIEEETGKRVSIFLITTSGKEITKKRFQDLKETSNKHELTRLVEGAFGSYSSFWIDSNENIHDLAIMSQENREKIINLLDRKRSSYLPKELIEEEKSDFIRYKFSDKKDKSIDYEYLKYLITIKTRNPKIKEQPLRFCPFIEGERSGIDVLLASQFDGIRNQLAEYYNAKYDFEKGKKYVVDIHKIDDFFNTDKEKNDRQPDEKI